MNRRIRNHYKNLCSDGAQHDGREISYGYDCGGRLASVTIPEGVFRFGYDSLGRRASLTHPNGLTTRYTYTDSGRLSSMATDHLFDMRYRYDRYGRRTAMIDQEGQHGYVYDAAQRLAAATHPCGSESFSYDVAGNRQGARVDAANQLLEDEEAVYTYDASGNLSSREVERTGEATVYEWDCAGRLTSVTSPRLQAEYRYDWLGQRIEKCVSGTVNRYAYDAWDSVAEYDGDGRLRAWYVRVPGTGEPLCMIKEGAIYFYHCDGSGSVIGMTDERGKVIQKYAYSVFGSVVSTLDRKFQQPFAFAGQPFDAETGFYCFPYRYYAPDIGRFLSPDPLGYVDGVNPYAYVRNDPVNVVDPLGLYGVDVHLHLTNQLALKVGFAKGDALTIARANQDTDEGISSPYNPLGGTQLHFMPREFAIKGLETTMRRPGRLLKPFGHYLHILQDTYSHEGFKWYIHMDKNGMIDIGHARAGTAPDYYVPSSLRDMAMVSETEYYLRRALDAWTPKIMAAPDKKPKVTIGPGPARPQPFTPTIRAWPDKK